MLTVADPAEKSKTRNAEIGHSPTAVPRARMPKVVIVKKVRLWAPTGNPRARMPNVTEGMH